MPYPSTLPVVANGINTSPFTDASGCFEGTLYAFTGVGGFYMEKGIDDVKFRAQEQLIAYDTTNAVHIKLCDTLLNAQLGLNKKMNGGFYELSGNSFYNDVSDCFVAGGVAGGAMLDSVTITAADFLAATANPDNIICVGAYDSLYSEFITYIHKYFGFSGGFASLFSGDSTYDISGQLNDGVFDVSQLWQLIQGGASSGPNGSYQNALTGSITVSNITGLLRQAVDSNAFNNRNPSNGTTAIDSANHANYGVADGFMPGDVIFCPSGTQIILNLDIDEESFDPLNNVGPTNAAAPSGSVVDFTTTQTSNDTNYVNVTTANLKNIKKTAQAPLAIHVVACSP